MKLNILSVITTFTFVSARLTGFSQVNIEGPVCVIPGTIYQYTIKGTSDSSSAMQVCVVGGTIYDSSGSKQCSPQNKPLSSVLVTWSVYATGTINVSSLRGDASLRVNITSVLDGGSIAGNLSNQTIESGSIPLSINCSPAKGGSCSPLYSYQWQSSQNELTWTDIKNAKTQNLSFSKPLLETTYFRRQTKETVSGTIVYSDLATVNTTVMGPR
jgi:hypothetical protein